MTDKPYAERADGYTRFDPERQFDKDAEKRMPGIRLEDRTTWPLCGTIWTHRNGNVYQVAGYANEEAERQDDYPTTILYRNVKNHKLYSRRLVDWDRSMTFGLGG